MIFAEGRLLLLSSRGQNWFASIEISEFSAVGNGSIEEVNLVPSERWDGINDGDSVWDICES